MSRATALLVVCKNRNKLESGLRCEINFLQIRNWGCVQSKNAINFYRDSAPPLLLARTPTTANAVQIIDNQWHIENACRCWRPRPQSRYIGKPNAM
jgi:hypothetical protein